MKKLFFVAMGLAVLASACKKNVDVEKPLINVPGAVLDTLKGEITVNSTVSEDTYLLGVVYVKPGVTLTINPGVTIYGSPNTNGGTYSTTNLELNKGVLCIERGAKLNAAGTCSSPIIWTSDNKIPVGQRKVGDWGGVVLYGAAPMHNGAGNPTGRNEAFDVVPNDARNFYGGAIANDNSGVMTYNRIEFGGGVVTAVNKEINGLTLCAVGSGTVINHIEILKSGDDSFEFFGGTVNLDHLLSYAARDDDFDFDEGYQGNLQFIIAVRDSSADISGSHMIETDNDNGTAGGPPSTFTPNTAPFITNATLIGPAVAHNFVNPNTNYFEAAVMTRRNSSMRIINSYIVANAMPFGLLYTPTTGVTGTFAPLLDPPSLTIPGSINAYNVLQINNPSFAGIAVQNTVEGNNIPAGSLANNADLINKLVSVNNATNALTGVADFNFGNFLENTGATPFLHTGLALPNPPFVTTDERGGVVTTDKWTEAAFTCNPTRPWLSIATN